MQLVRWTGMKSWDSIRASKKLLEALWDGDETAVADGIARAHEEVSILQYNDENSLSCTIHLAFYFAREYYTIIRELPAGKGLQTSVFFQENCTLTSLHC